MQVEEPENVISNPKFQIIREISRGQNSQVYLAWHTELKKQVALKRVQRQSQFASREYETLIEVIGQPNIVKIYDFFYSILDDGVTKVENFVFEYIEDDLENVIYRLSTGQIKMTLAEFKQKSYSFQLLNGIKCLHKKFIAHRDLKPANILISKSSNLKICDFGSAKKLLGEGRNSPHVVARFYRAPELLFGDTNYSTAIDMWALACILYELATCDVLFQGSCEQDQFMAIVSRLGCPTITELEYLLISESKAQSVFDKYKSVTASTNWKDNLAWINHKDLFVDLLIKMLKFLPSQRITVIEAMNHKFFKEIIVN